MNTEDLWKDKIRHQAKELLSLLSIDRRDPEIKNLMKKIQTPYLTIHLALLIHELNVTLKGVKLKPRPYHKKKKEV